jgi:hypothetical protein
LYESDVPFNFDKKFVQIAFKLEKASEVCSDFSNSPEMSEMAVLAERIPDSVAG